MEEKFESENLFSGDTHRVSVLNFLCSVSQCSSFPWCKYSDSLFLFPPNTNQSAISITCLVTHYFQVAKCKSQEIEHRELRDQLKKASRGVASWIDQLDLGREGGRKRTRWSLQVEVEVAVAEGEAERTVKRGLMTARQRRSRRLGGGG